MNTTPTHRPDCPRFGWAEDPALIGHCTCEAAAALEAAERRAAWAAAGPVSPYTGHALDCPTYDTLDAADCTCPYANGPEAPAEDLAYLSYNPRTGQWVPVQ